ncbi:MAG TPA: extracellular solute-binding protein [Candidatus Binatia bacterium]|nr:extracellular solute-binding protein [Candidatus Binatia bacterium]
MVRALRTWLAGSALLGGLVLASTVEGAGPAGPPTTSHGLSMYGDLKYGPGFTHFDYANPAAPKGGDVRLAAIGTFDTLNPYVLRGVPAAGLGYLADTLTMGSSDEAFARYGLIAESIELPADRSWVAFTLRREARFHDGSPIAVEDVIWTFETLRKRGHPFYRGYYRHVAGVDKVGERTVRFRFQAGENRELPLIVGEMPVLPRAYWSARDFERTTLELPLGSGPYRIESIDPGRSITYRRVKDYWGADLPVNAGRFNFETIRYDYYRDGTISLEAFKAGRYDFRQENAAKNWATAYTGPAVRQGLIKREEIPNEIPTGMQAFVFNTRQPVFRDPRVREALAYAFDFEWTNQHLFWGAYTRTRSYFSNSELASRGRPGPGELAVLEPHRAAVPHEVFTRPYDPPSTAPPGSLRVNLLTALAKLREAGWEVRDFRLVNARTGEPMRFEILLSDPGFERIVLPFVKNLERLGVSARVRTVDTAQYRYRVDHFDFDMIVHVWRQSLSPGNEQRDYWTSEKATVPGSENLAGIRDPVVDALVDAVIAAPDRPDLVDRTRALDRVLLWGYYVVPQWHFRAFRVAYWDFFARPRTAPRYALGFDTWWVDPALAAAARSWRTGGR